MSLWLFFHPQHVSTSAGQVFIIGNFVLKRKKCWPSWPTRQVFHDKNDGENILVLSENWNLLHFVLFSLLSTGKSFIGLISLVSVVSDSQHFVWLLFYMHSYILILNITVHGNKIEWMRKGMLTLKIEFPSFYSFAIFLDFLG